VRERGGGGRWEGERGRWMVGGSRERGRGGRRNEGVRKEGGREKGGRKERREEKGK